MGAYDAVVAAVGFLVDWFPILKMIIDADGLYARVDPPWDEDPPDDTPDLPPFWCQTREGLRYIPWCICPVYEGGRPSAYHDDFGDESGDE